MKTTRLDRTNISATSCVLACGLTDGGNSVSLLGPFAEYMRAAVCLPSKEPHFSDKSLRFLQWFLVGRVVQVFI